MATATAPQIRFTELGYVEQTPTGPRCGNHGRDHKVHHVSVEAVKICYAITAEQNAQIEADHAAEAAVERWHEERGWQDTFEEDWYRVGSRWLH